MHITDNHKLAITKISGLISAILGLVVILGWYTNNVSLIQVSPVFAPMQYNTALGFLLSGVGFLFLAHNRRRVTLVAGSIVAAIGFLTLIQYISGVNFGIDQLLMEHYITTKTSHPGRMAPNTALCFSLVALCARLSETKYMYYLIIISQFSIYISTTIMHCNI